MRLVTVSVVGVIALTLLGIWWFQRDAVPSDKRKYGKSVAVTPFDLKSEGMESLAYSLGEELAYALGMPLVGGSFHMRHNYTQQEVVLSEIVMNYFFNFAATG